MEWVFFRNVAGHWCWECRGASHVVKESKRPFTSRRDCIADAIRNGFVAGPVPTLEPVEKPSGVYAP